LYLRFLLPWFSCCQNQVPFNRRFGDRWSVSVEHPKPSQFGENSS
jgi:hypothetical protein